jgi:predicted helicase
MILRFTPPRDGGLEDTGEGVKVQRKENAMPKERLNISANDSALRDYYATMQRFADQQVKSEGNVRRAFGQTLSALGRKLEWVLVEELSRKSTREGRVIPDGTLRDAYRLPRGYWEAKDSHDDIDAEIAKKKGRGYPLDNIIFEDTQTAVLYQDGNEVRRAEMSDSAQLAHLLEAFFNYQEEIYDEFESAIEAFADVVPDIGRGLQGKIASAHKDNRAFQEAFAQFENVCKTALNPNISREAIDEMLIQHMLTERLLRQIFDMGTFSRNNVIAREVENVIDALTSQHFNRSEFLGRLDRFYKVIEQTAQSLEAWDDKQTFINNVYEQFFQGYSVAVADTHGIVYTPQEIVDFMGAAVEEVLHDEFGKDLGEEGVTVLDPCTGTGNFVINLLNRVSPRHRRDFYKERLFANEVMLMPYYIASLNIEHEYYRLEREVAPFEGMCFVDTLDIAKGRQMTLDMFGEANTARVTRQQNAPINVIIGNPPYNAGQINENDNNKNRAYAVIDDAIKNTYAKDSNASNNNALYDAYVKFFKWATDRLDGRDGVVCYVSNSGFVDGIAFDGMRKHLYDAFTRIYVLDMAGNARTSGEQRRREGGNVFHDLIRVGVSITVAVKHHKHTDRRIFYHRVGDYWTAEQKLAFLKEHVERQGRQNSLNTITWQTIQPDSKNNWILSEYAQQFEGYMPIGDKDAKASKGESQVTIFKNYSRGLETTRDAYVYGFDRQVVADTMRDMSDFYNAQVEKWAQVFPKPKQKKAQMRLIDDFVTYDDKRIKWSSNLKQHLASERQADFNQNKIRKSLYRPFSMQYVYFDDVMNHRQGQMPKFFPTPEQEKENRVIGVTDKGSEKPFMVMMHQHITDLHLVGAGSSTQTFPFYVYDEAGENRRENITDWALGQFRAHYGDDGISKWDIFYYVYGILHHPDYREKFADDLKKQLPRVPMVNGISSAKSKTPPQTPPRDGRGLEDAGLDVPLITRRMILSSEGDLGGGEGANAFRHVVKLGKALAELHLGYEEGERYKLKWDIEDSEKLHYRVEKMKPLGKKKVVVQADEARLVPTKDDGGDLPTETITVYDALRVNETLVLRDIPEKAFSYRLGNRSALDWVVEQYRVKTDKRSGITSDPNQYSDDAQYIVKLVERVVHVSVQTVDIVEQLAQVNFD